MSEDRGVASNRVRAVRISKGIDMATLAEMAGISSSYLGMIERGTRSANAEVLEKLAVQLGVETTDLLAEGLSGPARDLWERYVAPGGGPASANFAWKLKALRNSRDLSVRALCETPDGLAAGLKAWLVREFELGARQPSDAEMQALAKAFGFPTAGEFEATLNQTARGGADGLIRSENRAARRLAYDRDSEEWPELVLKATSHGITGDQAVIDGRQLNGSFVASSAKVLVDRSVRIDEGDLVVAIERKRVIGMGRVQGGAARDEKGRELHGSLWRVVSMLFP